MRRAYPSKVGSVLLLLLISSVLFVGVLYELNTSALIFVNIAILLFVAVLYKTDIGQLEELIIDGLKRVAPAILIVLIVGAMISMWIQCGLVPMIVYYGTKWLQADILLIATFFLSCIFAICTGSSWGTCGTVGIACASIGASMGIPVYVMAGVAISGATLGDKISPFSDTTIVAAGIAECSVYEHINAMLLTTIPSFVLTCLVYVWLGARYSPNGGDLSATMQLQAVLSENFRFSPWLLIIPAAVFVLSLKKIHPLVALTFTTVLSAGFSFVLQGNGLPEIVDALYYGTVAATGDQLADAVLNRGGIVSMTSVIITIILCVMMSSIVRQLHLLDGPMEMIRDRIKSDKGLILSTLFSGLFMVLFLSSLYVSGIMLGEFFRSLYKEREIKPGVLSRVIEESTTVTTPLIPWHSSYNYYHSLFGLTDMRFIPYAVFCWLNLLLSIVFTALGIGLKGAKLRPWACPASAAEEKAKEI